MSEERFFKLVSRKLAGEASLQELQELDDLVMSNTAWAELYQKVFLGNATVTNDEQDEADASFALHVMKMQLYKQDEGLQSVPEYQPNEASKRVWIPWAMSVAAILMLYIGYNLLLEPASLDIQKQAVNEVVSRKASRSTIKLPDGTRVWLNADSKLAYATDFTGKTREVTLTGEAYFDVMKDSSRPFIIHTDKINIRVLGTAFNVKSYPQDEIIETALIHGKIEVTYVDRPSEKVIMQPNEKLTIRKNQGTGAGNNSAQPKIQLANMAPPKDSLVAETAWMENKLAFSNESLEGIARSLERQFDVTIDFKSEEPKQYTYTGLFEHEGIEKILRMLSLSQPFRYTVNGTHITIEP